MEVETRDARGRRLIGTLAADALLAETCAKGIRLIRHDHSGSISCAGTRRSPRSAAVEMLMAEILGHYRSSRCSARSGEGPRRIGRQGLKQSMAQEVERIFRLLGLAYPQRGCTTPTSGYGRTQPLSRRRARVARRGMPSNPRFTGSSCRSSTRQYRAPIASRSPDRVLGSRWARPTRPKRRLRRGGSWLSSSAASARRRAAARSARAGARSAHRRSRSAVPRDRARGQAPPGRRTGAGGLVRIAGQPGRRSRGSTRSEGKPTTARSEGEWRQVRPIEPATPSRTSAARARPTVCTP